MARARIFEMNVLEALKVKHMLHCGSFFVFVVMLPQNNDVMVCFEVCLWEFVYQIDIQA